MSERQLTAFLPLLTIFLWIVFAFLALSPETGKAVFAALATVFTVATFLWCGLNLFWGEP